MKKYIVWAEYRGRSQNLCGIGINHDRDTATEIAQDFLWDTELSRPDALPSLKVSIVPALGDGNDWDNAERIEI